MSLRGGKSFCFWKRLPPPKLLFLRRLVLRREFADIFWKRLPPFFANLLRGRSLIVLVGHVLWGKAAMSCESVSPLPCGLAPKTCVIYAWVFSVWCTLLFLAKGFVASTRILGRDSLGFLVCNIHFYFWLKVLWLRLLFWVVGPLAF